MRLNKYLAACGIASRRGSEALIAKGLIEINGVVADSPAIMVQDNDKVTYHNEAVKLPAHPRLWCYYKPVGLICSHADESGRKTVFDTLPDSIGRVISVGRLDLNSEGLLLLTNNGEVARQMENPVNALPRTYRVRIRGFLSDRNLEKICRGITIEGMRYRPAEVIEESRGATNSWLNVTLFEGKNREIRRIFEHFGHPVNRLIRVGYGDFSVNGLKSGDLYEVVDAIERLKKNGLVLNV